MFNPNGHSVVTCHYTQRLVISNLLFNATKSECLYRMQEQLAVLNYSTLFDSAHIEKLVISGDGETTKFSGDILDENTVQAIRNLSDYSDIRVDLQYSYTWYNETPEIVASPDKIVKALLEADDEIFDHIFFSYQELSTPESCFDYDDYEEALTPGLIRVSNELTDPGKCHVYGWLEGKLYKGEVDPVEVANPPYDSKWICFPDIVSLTGVSVDGKGGERIKEICNQLAEMTMEDCPTEKGGKLSFSPSEFQLNTYFDVERFAKLIGELKVLCKDNGTLKLLPRFWDHNSENLRMLFIDVAEDGSYNIKISEIAKGNHKYLNGKGYTDSDKVASILLKAGSPRWDYTEFKLTQSGSNIEATWTSKKLRNRKDCVDEGNCVYENKNLSDFVDMFNAVTFADHKDYELNYAWDVLFLDENGDVTGGYESGYWYPEVIESAAKMLEVFLGQPLPQSVAEFILDR